MCVYFIASLHFGPWAQLKRLRDVWFIELASGQARRNCGSFSFVGIFSFPPFLLYFLYPSSFRGFERFLLRFASISAFY